MNDQELEQDIQAKGLTAPRITSDQIEALMERVTCSASRVPGTTLMVMHAFLDDKFYLASAHSAYVSPENFNEQIGFQIAHEKIIPLVKDKLWELEGYRLFRELNPDVEAPQEQQAQDEEQPAPEPVTE